MICNNDEEAQNVWGNQWVTDIDLDKKELTFLWPGYRSGSAEINIHRFFTYHVKNGTYSRSRIW
jgi:hypothetical protein